MEIQSPKGTKDILPGESHVWQRIEQVMREEAALAGYREIRTPVFEHTELFLRGVGDTSDIVQKEMYTFLDKGDRSITLKPEGTAGVVRALVENRLYAEPLPCKMYYVNSPVFRYEKPQHGRLREHHQFGMECFGSKEPTADAEVILTILKILTRLGLQNLSVKINSIGCPVCRPRYNEELTAYLSGRQEELCPQCRERLVRNPLRVLDCKEPGCKAIVQGAPGILNHLCPECDHHFADLKSLLKTQGLSAQVDPHIVRGLDYYTKTVFEIIMQAERGEMTLCGGGRYDGLVREIGGPEMSGVGFGIGTERIILELNKQGVSIPQESVTDLYIANIGPEARDAAFSLCMTLRARGIKADMDHLSRSLKAQLRYADKLGARLLAILGGEELAKGAVKLKDMQSGQETATEISRLPETVLGLL